MQPAAAPAAAPAAPPPRPAPEPVHATGLRVLLDHLCPAPQRLLCRAKAVCRDWRDSAEASGQLRVLVLAGAPPFAVARLLQRAAAVVEEVRVNAWAAGAQPPPGVAFPRLVAVAEEEADAEAGAPATHRRLALLRRAPALVVWRCAGRPGNMVVEAMHAQARRG